MDEFRKKMHIAYKQKIVNMIMHCFLGIAESEELDAVKNLDHLHKLVVDWVNANCLPMGDFDKEKAMKEIEEWDQ